MKILLIAILFSISILFSSVFYSNKVKNITQDLLQSNKQIIELVEDNNYHDAYSYCENMCKYLENNIVTLSTVNNHEDIDMLALYMAQLSEYIRCEQKHDALALCNALKVLCEHLPHAHKIQSENIL